MRLVSFLVFATVTLLSSGVSTTAQEFSTGLISISRDVGGVPVTISTMLYFQARPAVDRLVVRARADVDLSDLQAKFGAIVDMFKLPTNNCRSYNADNPVVSISRKDLGFRGRELTFAISGNVTMWDCRENPIPKSKVEWIIEDVGFGIKTKVPKVITWPGDPIKNKLGSQSFDITLPIGIRRADATSVELVLGRPDVNLKGQYAFITKGILSIAGININEKLDKALRAAIEPGMVRASLPDELMRYGPAIESVAFADRGGRLHMDTALTMKLSAADGAKLVAEFFSDAHPGSQLTETQTLPGQHAVLEHMEGGVHAEAIP